MKEVTDRIINQLQTKNSWGKNEAIEMINSVRTNMAFELLNQIESNKEE